MSRMNGGKRYFCYRGIVSAFNLKKNLRYLFQRPGHNIPTIDGIRACSLLLVIVCHLIFFSQFFISSAHIEFSKLPLWIKWMVRGDLGVDAFFVISGFLIGGILFREYKKTNKIEVFTFFKRRFLRLTPVYWTLLLLIGFFSLGDPTSNVKNIWANIIYVNNFLSVKTMFMPYTWSLAIEEQFYLIFPFLCLLFLKTPLRRHPFKVLISVTALYIAIRIGVTLHLVDVVFNLTGIQLLQYSLSPLDIFNDVEMGNIFFAKFDILYGNLYTKFIALFAGVVAAYYHVFNAKKATQFFSRRWMSNGFFVLAVGLIVMTFIGGFLFSNQRWFLTYDIIFYQVTFSISLAYFFLYTIYSPSLLNKPFKAFFGSKLLYPIAQLSYSAYLSHVFIIHSIYMLLITNNSKHSMVSLIVTGVPYVIGITLTTSVILYLFIERPFMNLREKKDSPPEKLIIVAEPSVRPFSKKEVLN